MGAKTSLSNAQYLFDIASLNRFLQVAFNELLDLAIGESRVQL